MSRSGIRSRRAGPSMAGAIAWACLLGLLHAPVADAQSVDIPAMVTADERVPPTVATFQYGHQFESDVEDIGTEMERDNALFSLGHRV